MKHLTLLLIISCITLQNIHSQSKDFDFDKKYDELLEQLSKENWKESFSLSQFLLKNIENDTSKIYACGVIRYMNILSASGLMYKQELSKTDALKKVEDHKNKLLVLPGHPVQEKGNLNCIKYIEDKPNTLFVCQTNQDGTNLFSFDYATIKLGITKDQILQHQGINAVIAGILDTISVEGSLLPRFKTHLKDATIEFEK
jgi:hypothetical protein